ncbi:hypothetical protein [Microscilla marina]|uniref:Uncharacterized protein n=1 Tax=Microscilla marina ATCC 23134 TaxID=313606 RepID=A1ZRL5_MICM2|nr:hypothetical protein [Microscilla marina]EAY26920.1 hypothetical protein M23134_03571 [Microscilla marina ATCC 23134]
MKRTLVFLGFLGAMAVLLLAMRGYFGRNPRVNNYKKKYQQQTTNYQQNNDDEGQEVAKLAEVNPADSTSANTNNQTDPILGTWKITKSFDLNGTSYEGAVKFSKKGGEYYQLQWNTNAGSYQGVAIKKGQNLFVGWGNSTYGIVAYKINKDGTLAGEWIASQSSRAGTEKLSGGQPGVIEGKYKVNGSMGEKAYQGGITVTKTGTVYQLSWQLKPDGQKGVGIVVGDYLVVGWGFGTSFGVVNYAIKGNKMLGRWTIGAADREGIENLEKVK